VIVEIHLLLAHDERHALDRASVRTVSVGVGVEDIKVILTSLLLKLANFNALNSARAPTGMARRVLANARPQRPFG